jgi:S-DNA-T family DNA segregation ATPase FtsK/SpoIIIE
MSAPKDEGVLLGDVKSRTQVPGRGHLVSRRTGSALIQVAWQPPLE